MAGIQTNLSFCVRKKTQSSFYSNKLDAPKEKLAEENKAEREECYKPKPSTPTVKKIIELDSEDENIDLTNTRKPRRVLKRKITGHTSSNKKEYSDESSDSECSPTKKSRAIRNTKLKSQCDELPLQQISTSEQNIEIDNEDHTKNFNDMRVALHAGTSKSLPGRKDELDKLTSFLNSHLDSEQSGTLYISGPPGTGKTACLMNILERPEFQKGFTEVYVNCTSMKSAGSIYNRICQELHIKSNGNTEKAYLKAIEKHLSKKHDMILLVLDEIDQLSSKRQSVLYTIFEWPSWPKSNLVLIGIANALDLTDRILPRLQARCDLLPELMHFAPYSKQQIIEIFTERLNQDINGDLFSPLAIQMLAGKVAAISGDVRRALDIGRRVVELSSPKTNYKKTGNATTTKPSVELKQVMSVLNDVYGASQRLETDMDDSFPLQQKIMLCTLLLILTKGKNKDVTVGKLYDVYKRVCTKRNLVAVDSTEFVSLCGLVETRGIIRLYGKKEARTQRVVLQWDESEVSGALVDKRMISDILNDVNCLG